MQRIPDMDMKDYGKKSKGVMLAFRNGDLDEDSDN